MLDLPTALAAQQEAVLVIPAVGAELIAGTLSCADFVDTAGLLQLFQLSVNRGKPHRFPGLVQIFCQLGGGQGLIGPLFQAVKHGLLLFGNIRHARIYKLKMIIILVL